MSWLLCYLREAAPVATCKKAALRESRPARKPPCAKAALRESPSHARSRA